MILLLPTAAILENFNGVTKRKGGNFNIYLGLCHTRQFVLATYNAFFAEKNIAGYS